MMILTIQKKFRIITAMVIKNRYLPQVHRKMIPGSGHRKMTETIRLIGKSIRHGSRYLPIRNYAAGLATKAPPKNYLGQVKEIYDDITKRWRYVNDPFGTELLTFGPKALATLVLGLDDFGVGHGYGAGDCDCVTAATGACLMSIGRPTRITVTAPRNASPGNFFSHVFCQCLVPKIGWVTVDPVLYPDKPFGAITEHSRIAYYNLSGQLTGYAGNVTW